MFGGRGAGSGAVATLGLLVAILLFGTGDRRGDVAGHGEAVPELRPGGSVEADVRRVVDGDTIEAWVGGRAEDVRYIGIDTPETVKPDAPVECFGKQASERNRELVDGETVRLRFDRELRDAYGRLLAYVFAGGEMVNARLVREGHARTLEIEPNTARAGKLAALEERAAVAGVGLWEAC